MVQEKVLNEFYVVKTILASLFFSIRIKQDLLKQSFQCVLDLSGALLLKLFDALFGKDVDALFDGVVDEWQEDLLRDIGRGDSRPVAAEIFKMNIPQGKCLRDALP